MSKTGYIYPKWFAAIDNLTEELMKHRGSSDPLIMRQVVISWFKSHVFNVGVDLHTDRYMIDRMNIDASEIRNIQRDQASRMIAAELFKNELYMSRFTGGDRFKLTERFEVLVFGSPAAIEAGSREKRDG